jgi:hypothetical protein
MRELARQIGDKRLMVSDSARAVKALEYTLEERQIDVLGATDYKALGSNEAERKVKQEALLRQDPQWKATHDALHSERSLFMKLEGELKALEDVRRGEEWLIRAALAGLEIPSDSEHVDDDAFVDYAVERKVAESTRRPPPPPDPPSSYVDEINAFWGNQF